MKLLISFLVNAVALGVAILLLPGITLSGDNRWLGLAILAVIFGLINTFLKPLIKLLALPINVMTFGLFSLVINAGLLLLTAALAGNFNTQLSIGGYPPTFGLDAIVTGIIGGLLIAIVSTLLGFLLPDRRR